MTSSHYCRYSSLMAQQRLAGGEGAMLAVNEAMAYMSQKVQGGELGLNDVLATDIVLTIRQRLFAEAEAKELAVRDFAWHVFGIDFIS